MSTLLNYSILNDADMVPTISTSEVPPQYATLKTTSAKIRAMATDGYERKAIAKALNIRYQHVRNVLVQPLKKGEAI